MFHTPLAFLLVLEISEICYTGFWMHNCSNLCYHMLPYGPRIRPLLMIFLVKTRTLVSTWVHEKLVKPILPSVCILMVSLLFKWAMVTFQLNVNIYCATKLFFPSPMGNLGSSMPTAVFMVAAPYFWQHEGWCCAAGLAQQSCAYAVFLILAPWFELSQWGSVPLWLPKLFVPQPFFYS